MTLIKSSQTFYLNSTNRISGTDSNFLIKLGTLDRTKKFDHVVVLQAAIPKTYYLVTTGNNSFTLQEGTNSAQIILPIGNYSKISFRIVLQNLLNVNSPSLFTYTVAADNIATSPDTGKYTYTVSNNGGIQPEFIVNSEIHSQLGFFPNTTNTFVANILVSAHVVNFNLENTLFIHSNICQNASSNVLQDIFTTGIPTYSFIQYNVLDVEACSKIYTNNSDTYNFYITDENDFPIDLNGINANITVMLYEKNNTSVMIEDYIEMQKLKNLIDLTQEQK